MLCVVIVCIFEFKYNMCVYIYIWLAHTVFFALKLVLSHCAHFALKNRRELGGRELKYACIALAFPIISVDWHYSSCCICFFVWKRLLNILCILRYVKMFVRVVRDFMFTLIGMWAFKCSVHKIESVNKKHMATSVKVYKVLP